MTLFAQQSEPEAATRHLRNLTPADRALLTRAAREGNGPAVRRSLALAYERFGDEIRDAGGIYNIPAFRDPATASLLLQRFGAGDQIRTGGDVWLTQHHAGDIPATRTGRINISSIWFEEYVDALSNAPGLGSADLYDDARDVRQRGDRREREENRRVSRELVGKAIDHHDRLSARPTPSEVQQLEGELRQQADRIIEGDDASGRRHRRYELDDGSALIFWQHTRRRRGEPTEQSGVCLGTHRARIAALPANLRYPALFNCRSPEDASAPASRREYEAIEHGGKGANTLGRHRAAPSPNVERDYVTYLNALRRQGHIEMRDPRISSPDARVMRVGMDAPPPRDLQPFAGRQAGPDAEEWRNRLGSDPDATPDDDLAQLDALGVERIVRPDRDSVRLAFPDGSDSVIDMGNGAVQPVGQRARSPSPRAELPERQTNELIKSDGIEGDGGDKLPFRFADGGAIDAAKDPARAVPGVYLNPAANRELIGEYGRLWQSQAGHQQAEELRAEGKPVQASLQNLAADEWLRSTEPGPANAAARPGRTNPRLASALSNLVSLEGEAQHHVEDWLANLQRDSQDKRAEHYRVADELLARGQTEPAALHQHIADRWADPTQGVEREVLEPALTDQGWRVVSLDDNREFFDQHVYRFRDPKSGRFVAWRGLYTHDMAAVHRLVKERYGADAYVAQYTDTRRGVESSHPFAVIDGTVHGAFDPQNLATPQPITHIYIPPAGWAPPNFRIDPERQRARDERRRMLEDSGRPATPDEITDDVEDIYERIAAGASYTTEQAASIRLAIREAQEAAAEASAASDRAALLANATQGLLRGARADLRKTGAADPDAAPASEPGADADPPDVPDGLIDALTGEPLDAPGGDPAGDALDAPADQPARRSSGRRLTTEELDEVAAVGADPRSPSEISERALYKAEKADRIADEAVQASQEAMLSASRMTRAFARLRELARHASRQADSLPDDVDDLAQTYADMADTEIDGAMPIVERTNQAALESRDMALLVSEEADDVLADVREVRTALRDDLGDAYVLPADEAQALGRASERYTREVASADEMEGKIAELQARVETRRSTAGAPELTQGDDAGVRLQPQLTPGRVYIPEGQATTLGQNAQGRMVRGYEVAGEFYPAADLSQVIDTATGQQTFQNPPEWVDESDPRSRRRLLYSTNILPEVADPPPPEPARPEGAAPAGPKELRDYQEQILDELDQNLAEVDSVLVTAPTGAGKTVTFAEKIRRLRAEGKSVAVIAHRQELIEQAERTIAAQTGEQPGVVWQNRREWGRPITIIAHGALLTGDPPVGYRPDVVIADEAHHAVAPGWQQAIDKLHPKQLVGFTATPFRTDEQELTPKPFARVVRPVTPAQLIEKGVLVPPKVESVALTDAEGNRQAINQASNLPQIYAESVSYALSQGRRKIILFVSQSPEDSPSQVARGTEQELRRLGINTRTIVAGGLTPTERQAAIREFEAAPSAVMVNYMTLTEGTDVPSTDTVILGRNTQSETALIQMIGRAMRPSPGKRNALVLDYTGRDDIADIVNYWRLDTGEARNNRQPSQPEATPSPALGTPPGVIDRKARRSPGPGSRITRREPAPGDRPRITGTPSTPVRAPAVFRRADAPATPAKADEFAYLDTPAGTMGSRARRRRRRDEDKPAAYNGGELVINMDELPPGKSRR